MQGILVAGNAEDIGENSHGCQLRGCLLVDALEHIDLAAYDIMSMSMARSSSIDVPDGQFGACDHQAGQTEHYAAV